MFAFGELYILSEELQDIAFHLSGVRVRRAQLANPPILVRSMRGGGAHYHLDAMSTGHGFALLGDQDGWRNRIQPV